MAPKTPLDDGVVYGKRHTQYRRCREEVDHPAKETADLAQPRYRRHVGQFQEQSIGRSQEQHEDEPFEPPKAWSSRPG